ncbi:LPXTG cell wall anchor domain-containing protein [Lactococcus garvieae]|uniref:LPXTG-motif cell wall anchor domain-containing protein n=1 Tax=Lactococcus garvieae TaxID=1363 RepID=A0A1I4J430_9LACT|nr:LPXTG cell wall anchor domain-containing protein [Lactococcus garvieae]SFL61310.1 LPXTG-motif cell wall anchor domain-containing protein [Lactococcus garvieae]
MKRFLTFSLLMGSLVIGNASVYGEELTQVKNDSSVKVTYTPQTSEKEVNQETSVENVKHDSYLKFSVEEPQKDLPHTNEKKESFFLIGGIVILVAIIISLRKGRKTNEQD